jgi:hypothetical protein
LRDGWGNARRAGPGRDRGPAISFEVARRRDGEDRRLDQLAGNEVRKARLAEADGEIDAFRHQVADVFEATSTARGRSAS